MCINCDDNSTEIPVGNDGEQGPAGNDGIFGGFSGEWIFSTSTTSGPASTFLRFDNATYSNVLNIYIADTNADSINYDAFLDSFDNGTQYGLIRVFKEFDSTKFWMGSIDGVTDNGTDHTIQVSHILSNGTFSANDRVIVTFSPRGHFVSPPQRLNTSFSKADTPYNPVTIATYTEIGTLVWDIPTYQYPEVAKVVVKPNTIGHTYYIKLVDNSSNVLWDTTFVAASTDKQVIDLGARLISPVSAIKYIEVFAKSDAVNPLRVYCIDLYNQ